MTAPTRLTTRRSRNDGELVFELIDPDARAKEEPFLVAEAWDGELARELARRWNAQAPLVATLRRTLAALDVGGEQSRQFAAEIAELRKAIGTHGGDA